MHARLEKIIGDPQVEVKLGPDDGAAGPSPVEGEGPTAVKELQAGPNFIPAYRSHSRRWPRARPTRCFWRSRGVEAYGISPIALYENDVIRAHGIDERIPVASVEPGLEFMYRLVVKLAGAP